MATKFDPNTSKLRQVAEASLRSNLVQMPSGQALRAGAHQFSSLWTRDFCYSVPGLLRIDEKAVVQNHLQLLLNAVTAEGWVPRLFDLKPSWLRVLRWTVGRHFLPSHRPGRVMANPLKAEFLGEHRTLAYDSGALVYLAFMQADLPHTAENLEALKRIVKFYERLSDDFSKPIVQTAYSDWQDSTRREGAFDYVNYLCLQVLKDAVQRQWIEVEALQDFEKVFRQEFLAGAIKPDESLHALQKGHRAVSLETHLFRIQDLIKENQKASALVLWKALKDHPVYHRSKLPGVAVDPEYPEDDVSFFTKTVGLRHYHDRLCWTWLAAEAAKTALQVGDPSEAERIFSILEEVCCALGDVPEVLDPVTLDVFETTLYRSEYPFSWGAAKIIEALTND